jgi:general secretion pathway protein F
LAVYEYKAIDSKGKNAAGIIEADSRISAGQLLKKMGLYPVGISETTQKTIETKSRDYSFSTILERISRADVSVFTTQFAALVEAGMPVVTSFDIAIQQTVKKSMKKMLSVIKEEVNKGSTLGDAFKLFPNHFSPLYVNMVRAGEESGSLEIVLRRLADFLESQNELRSKITAALAYPTLMLIVAVVVVFFLVTFVIPTVTTIFVEMHQALPLPTMILLGLSGILKKTWFYILGFFVAVFLFYRRYRRTPRGRERLDRWKLKIPLFGAQYKKIMMARFTRTLGTLLSNGVPVVTSFDIVKNIIDNTPISREIEKARDDIKEGKEIAKPLSQNGIFPPVVVNMIAIGEKSGQLEEMLNRVSRIMEAEIESSLKRLMSLLEPIMILLMGGVVLFIVIAILLPIFEMNQLIK